LLDHSQRVISHTECGILEVDGLIAKKWKAIIVNNYNKSFNLNINITKCSGWAVVTGLCPSFVVFS